jgi:hypothetical protein
MTVVGQRRRRRQPLHDFRNRIRYWDIKEEAEGKKKDGNDSLSIEHKEVSSINPWIC